MSAPMSFTGSAVRISRLRRHARTDRELAAYTAGTVALIACAWSVILVWYLMWGLLLVPYRIARRRSRQRQVEALRHRELLVSMNGAAAARPTPEPAADALTDRVTDSEREQTAERLRTHMLLGQLTVEELEERLAAAHRARTRADLHALIGDLPLPRTAPTPARDTARPPRPGFR